MWLNVSILHLHIELVFNGRTTSECTICTRYSYCTSSRHLFAILRLECECKNLPPGPRYHVHFVPAASNRYVRRITWSGFCTSNWYSEKKLHEIGISTPFNPIENLGSDDLKFDTYTYVITYLPRHPAECANAIDRRQTPSHNLQ